MRLNRPGWAFRERWSINFKQRKHAAYSQQATKTTASANVRRTMSAVAGGKIAANLIVFKIGVICR
jgi:hypothetical protein